MKSEPEDRIKSAISSVFEISVDDVKDNLAHDMIESWDSLNHMNLVIVLEEEFEIEFTDNEIVEMTNYSLIKNIIMGKR